MLPPQLSLLSRRRACLRKVLVGRTPTASSLCGARQRGTNQLLRRGAALALVRQVGTHSSTITCTIAACAPALPCQRSGSAWLRCRVSRGHAGTAWASSSCAASHVRALAAPAPAGSATAAGSATTKSATRSLQSALVSTHPTPPLISLGAGAGKERVPHLHPRLGSRLLLCILNMFWRAERVHPRPMASMPGTAGRGNARRCTVGPQPFSVFSTDLSSTRKQFTQRLVRAVRSVWPGDRQSVHSS